MKARDEKDDDMLELEDLLKGSQDYIENIYCRNKRDKRRNRDEIKRKSWLRRAFGQGDSVDDEEEKDAQTLATEEEIKEEAE